MAATRSASDHDRVALSPAQPDREACTGADIAALRERGAHRFDPSCFAYIEALARRAAAQQGAARQLLQLRLNRAVTAYTARIEQARTASALAMPERDRRYPQTAEYLRRLHDEGDFRTLRKRVAQLEGQRRRGPLGELVDDMNRQSAGQTQGDAATVHSTARPQGRPPEELKTLRQFRDTWTRLRVDGQLTRSQAKIPENPGPLNSHLLVLRSLRQMQGISPAYLQHFMGHVETLLWLDQAQVRGTVAPVKPVRQQRGRKKGKRNAG